MMNALPRSSLAIAGVVATMAGCYIVPIGPDGQPAYPVAVPAQAMSTAPAYVPSSVLQARLYPINDVASQTGVLSGTITTRPGSTGQFQLNYQGEILTGEATRVSNDERRGIASAYGPSGLSMSCDYQMMNTRQGAGTCSFSNGARYQVHVGGGVPQS
jgi:hypothetical protein